MWVVNIDTLKITESHDDTVLASDEEDFETEFKALEWVMSRAKHLEDYHHNEELRYAQIAAGAAQRMKDLTC